MSRIMAAPTQRRTSIPLRHLHVLPFTSISHPDQHPFDLRNETSHSEVNKLNSAPRPISHPINNPKSPLHSILKKPQTAHSESQKTTRLLLPKPDGASITPPPVMPDLPPKEGTAGCQTIPKKAHFAPTRAARGTRRRPVFTRKSSQTTVPKVASPPRPRLVHSHPVKAFQAYDSFYDDGLGQLNRNVDSSDSAGEDVDADWADFDPFDAPVTLSQRTNRSSTPPKLEIMTDTFRPFKKTNTSPAALQDPMPHTDMVETVSPNPKPLDKDTQHAEPQYRRFPSGHRKYVMGPDKATDVPGFADAKRTPMPESMTDDLVRIIAEPHTVREEVTVPGQPWVWCEGRWRTPTEKQPLHDWMIRDEGLAQNPQPSYKPLVEKYFRTKFAEWMSGEIAMEESQNGTSIPHE